MERKKAKRKENLARIHHLFFQCLPNNKFPDETLEIIPDESEASMERKKAKRKENLARILAEPPNTSKSSNHRLPLRNVACTHSM